MPKRGRYCAGSGVPVREVSEREVKFDGYRMMVRHDARRRIKEPRRRFGRVCRGSMLASLEARASATDMRFSGAIRQVKFAEILCA